MTTLPTRDSGAPPLIINRPDLQSRRMRLLYGLLTSLMWALWTYLWLPLISLIAWALGVRLFAIEMLLADNLGYLRDLLLYGQVLLAALLIILAWSHYNLARFRGHDRRRAPQPLTAADEATYHGVELELVTGLRGARIATVEYDASDRLVRVGTSECTDGAVAARPREGVTESPA